LLLLIEIGEGSPPLSVELALPLTLNENSVVPPSLRGESWEGRPGAAWRCRGEWEEEELGVAVAVLVVEVLAVVGLVRVGLVEGEGMGEIRLSPGKR
jgi:hypothetical protein